MNLGIQLQKDGQLSIFYLMK